MQPRYTCAYLNGASVKSWHSEKCTNKLGYICYSQVSRNRPTEGNHTYSSIPTHFTFTTLFSLMVTKFTGIIHSTVFPCSPFFYYFFFIFSAPETGHCSGHWVPYNGHCYYLDRTVKSWTGAQRACRQEGGDLVSIHNVEEQSFVISQLGYGTYHPSITRLANQNEGLCETFLCHNNVNSTT